MIRLTAYWLWVLLITWQHNEATHPLSKHMCEQACICTITHSDMWNLQTSVLHAFWHGTASDANCCLRMGNMRRGLCRPQHSNVCVTHTEHTTMCRHCTYCGLSDRFKSHYKMTSILFQYPKIAVHNTKCPIKEFNIKISSAQNCFFNLFIVYATQTWV